MYTKGPWEWVESRHRDGFSGIVGAGNAEVLFPAHCNDGDEGDAWFEELPSEADRNLIVAAPELLEACKDAYDFLCMLGFMEYELGLKLREVIEKAKVNTEVLK